MALSPRVSAQVLRHAGRRVTAGSRAGHAVAALARRRRAAPVLRHLDRERPFTPVRCLALGGRRGAAPGRSSGSVRLEGYVKRYDRVMEADWSEDPRRRGDEFLSPRASRTGSTRLHGGSRATGVGGWIAYSYGVSSRERDGVRWAPGSRPPARPRRGRHVAAREVPLRRALRLRDAARRTRHRRRDRAPGVRPLARPLGDGRPAALRRVVRRPAERSAVPARPSARPRRVARVPVRARRSRPT